MISRALFALALLLPGCSEKPEPPASSAAPAVHRAPDGPAPRAAAEVSAIVDAAPVPEDPVAPPGFKIDLLYTAPKEEGSWVCMTFDPKGRLIVSPEQGKPLRVTLGGEVKAERLDVDVSDAQGLLAAHKSLYVNGNGPGGAGLFRLPEEGDKYGAAVCLKSWPGAMGEHGPHGLALDPDGRICIMMGNHVKVPDGLDGISSPYRAYNEDVLLNRLPAPGGPDANPAAPGGYVLRTDAEGKSWDLFCGGLRNAYDLAFNEDGDLFTGDSDTEGDLGTPWYRPTRALHLVSGGEYGWRSGTGVLRPSSWDTLPPVVNLGPGSPTGVASGAKSRFPGKWKLALYVGDWAMGRINAVHLKPAGASYSGEVEPFITAKGHAVTDLEFGPDGSLYFITGGRGAVSELYRVSSAGGDGAPAPPAPKARTTRRNLETMHTKLGQMGVSGALVDGVHDPDRFVNFAARVALEHQVVNKWKKNATVEMINESAHTCFLAVARLAGRENLAMLLEAMNRYPWMEVDKEHYQLAFIRAYEVAFCRSGPPPPAMQAFVNFRFNSIYPDPQGSMPLNRELCAILSYLQVPEVVEKTLELLGKAEGQEDRIHFACCIRNMKDGWTPDLRKKYFAFLKEAAKFKGGAHLPGYVQAIRDDAARTLTADERKDLAPLLRP
jgi:glucose/arabinose dehydrogenase